MRNRLIFVNQEELHQTKYKEDTLENRSEMLNEELENDRFNENCKLTIKHAENYSGLFPSWKKNFEF